MRTILISGAANGLGASFVSAYSKQPNTQIIAIDREVPAQQSLGSNNIRFFSVDVSSESSINDLTSHLNNQPINLVIHCAGIRGLVASREAVHEGDVGACETLDVMDVATLTQTFAVNAVGTFLLLRALLPNLRLAGSLSETERDGEGQLTPKVIVIGSRMGSIGGNHSLGGSNTAAGSAYAYRSSKAAANAIVRSLAVDVPDVTFVICHPGRVETKLVRWKEEGAISADECVEGLIPMFEQWGFEQSGKFYDRFGVEIPW